MKEILIYGLAQNETRDYMEELLACFEDNSLTTTNIERVKFAATQQGFHSFRIATYNGEKPNFAATINL